jgi:hypothetical protein
VLIDTLSAPASSSLRISSTVRTPPPTVSGMKQASAVRAPRRAGVAVFVARGDVEKAQLVGAGGVIGDRAFDRIAGVAQIDEIDALDDAAVLDVEAGNDADLEASGGPRFPRSAPAPRRIEPAVIERAAGDRAGEFCARGASSALTSSIEARPPEAITGNRDRLGQRNGGIEIETLQQAVARDVGVDDRGDAGVLETRAIRAPTLPRSPPSLDRDLAVARVEPDRDPRPGKFRAASFTKSGSRTAAVPMMTRATPFSSQPLRPSSCRGCRRRAAPAW